MDFRAQVPAEPPLHSEKRSTSAKVSKKKFEKDGDTTVRQKSSEAA